MGPHEKIFIALDQLSLPEAVAMVDQLAPYGVGFKIGLELICGFAAEAVIAHAHGRRSRVIFDGKINDIPKTMEGAVRRLAGTAGVDAFTVHASASMDGLLAAASAKRAMRMFAVTVLTSMDEAAEAPDVFGAPASAKVLRFARDAKLGGADGIICSPRELLMLRRRPELAAMTLASPGIRPAWAGSDDQKRFLTPAAAIAAGADILIIGRPVTKPPANIGDSVTALQMIMEEVDRAMKGAA